MDGGHGGVGRGHGGGHGRGGGRRAAGIATSGNADLLGMAAHGEIEQTSVVTGLRASDNRATDTATFSEYSPPPACDNADTARGRRWQT